jgi:hypothetical protein
MATTSRFFHLENNILLEYIYADQGSPESYNTSDRGFNLISNSNLGIKFLVSDDDVELNSLNVRDNSAILIDSTNRKWASLDIDRPLQYQDYDSNITNSNAMSISFSPDVDVVYDKIKIHIPTGYDFKGKDGFIFELKVRQKSGTLHSLVSLVFRRDSTYATISPKPLLISDRLYDTYISFDVPSTYYLIQEFDLNPSDSNLLSHRLTGGQGLTTNNPIYASIYFINETLIENGFLYYKTTEERRISLNQIDEFADITASIEESINGDYFELTANVTGTTLEDYITSLNNMPNSDWIIMHEIKVTEQIGLGTTFLQTSDLSFIQDSNFGDPLLFRPIVLNSSNIATWAIDYAFRLFNKYDNSQIIKLASRVFSDASKYGRRLKQISLGTVPVIDKIYNLVQSNNHSLSESFKDGVTSTKYIANFFDRHNVSISIGVEIKDLNDKLNTETVNNDSDILKPSEGFIIIRPFDNYIKFTLYKLIGESFNAIDVTQLGNISLQFISDNGNKIKYNSIVDNNIFPSNGELLFLIPEQNTNEVLSYNDRSFYIVLSNENGIDTIVYSGTFLSQNEFKNETQEKIIYSLKQKVKNNNKQIDSLKKDNSSKDEIIAKLRDTIHTNDESIANLQAQNRGLKNGEDISALNKTNPAQKNQAAKSRNITKYISTEIDDNQRIVNNDTIGLTIKKYTPTVEEN